MGCSVGKSSRARVREVEEEVKALLQEKAELLERLERAKASSSAAAPEGGPVKGSTAKAEAGGDEAAVALPGSIPAEDAEGPGPSDAAPPGEVAIDVAPEPQKELPSLPPDGQASAAKAVADTPRDVGISEPQAEAARPDPWAWEDRPPSSKEVGVPLEAEAAAPATPLPPASPPPPEEPPEALGTNAPIRASPADWAAALESENAALRGQLQESVAGLDGASVAEEAPASTGTPDGVSSSQPDGSATPTPPGLSGVTCAECKAGGELFIDSSDMQCYCEACWMEYYGSPPRRSFAQSLVAVESGGIWNDIRLSDVWRTVPLPGWPPAALAPAPIHSGDRADPEGEVWSCVYVRHRRDVVGPHAQEQHSMGRPLYGEILAGRYRVGEVVGEGHFTRAFAAEDLTTGSTALCLKRHRNLSVEALSDLLAIGRRIDGVDPRAEAFPRLLDAFYDLSGFTVEGLLEGKNCLAIAQGDPQFFADLGCLRTVARGALRGLALLERAGVVHNDVKADNIIWTGRTEMGTAADDSNAASQTVKLVDFGCARLDQREDPGRNWALAENGAGHLGKWAPEMALRLPITHRSDVWGVAVSLCELHCGRFVWRTEADTVEVVVAQQIGLCGLRNGLPSSLLGRSPLDITQLYTPAPIHLPLRKNGQGKMEVLRPVRYGLSQVLGDDWQEQGKGDLQNFLSTALVADPEARPPASQLLQHRFAASPEEAHPRGCVANPEDEALVGDLV